MAVFTAAALAVGAAIATTTAATVATAVVAVSTAVGVAGLVVGGIGMAIGNEDLMFAGKVMGYVGMAGGLAGGLIGGVGALANSTGTFMEGFSGAFSGAAGKLSEGWDKGVGSWFAGGDKVTGAVGGTAAPSAPTNVTTAPVDTPVNAATPIADASKTVHPSSLGTGQFAQSPVTAPGVTAPGVTAPTAPTAIPSGMNNPSAWLPGAPQVPTGMNNPASWLPTTPPAGGGGGLVSGISEGFSSMPDWMKYSLMTTGAQGITGLAGGYFQGKSAEEQLAQQKLLADRDEAQRQLLNRQGNEIPSFRFGS